MTAYGGPHGHLISFMKRFVDEKQLLTKEELLSYHSFCSLMPGATSTQLICLLAYKKGGTKLSLLTLLIWIFPASFVMLSLSFYCLKYNLFSSTEKVFVFFQPMVIAYLIYSIIKTKYYYLDISSSKWSLAFNIFIILLFFKHPFILPILFLLNALHSNFRSHNYTSLKYRLRFNRFNINKIHFLVYITLFVSVAFLSEYSRKSALKNRYYFNIIEHNFRHGSMVYGGGDVLVPMMFEQYVTRPTAKFTKRRNPDILSLKKEELLSAAGLVRLVPGPVFSLTAFTTPFLLKDFNTSAQIYASALACLAIFIPGLLIILSLYPIWSHVNSNQIFSSYIVGVNLTVISIMIATSFYLSYDLFISFRYTPLLLLTQIVEVFSILLLLRYTKFSHGLIALMCLFAGLAYQFL